MGRSRKPPEYKPHPLLEELRPPLKASARRSLLKSMERVGQLSEILVTADGYILDGRTRLELAKELNTQPRIRYLTMHSCVGEVPPGYDRDWEMEQVRDVIEETGRGKWKDSPARREETQPQATVQTQATVQPQDDNDSLVQTTYRITDTQHRWLTKQATLLGVKGRNNKISQATLLRQILWQHMLASPDPI